MSFDQLLPIRNSFASTVKDTTGYLSKVKDELKEKEKNLLSYINDLIEKGTSGHDISEKTKEMSLIDSLREIHDAMSKYQRLSTKIQIDIIMSTASTYNDAKSTLNMEKTSMQNSEMMMRNISSVTQRENETNYLLAKPIKLMSDIDTTNKSINSLVKFVDEQISYLNRLDSAIRLKYNIKASGDFLDQTTSGTPSQSMVAEEDVTWDAP